MATTRRRVRRRAGLALAAAATTLVVATGCVADPPPPTVVGGAEDADGDTPVSLDAGGLLLTLDRVEEGFNPHLLADQGVDTDLVAALLLPSAFVPGPGGELVLNEDLLVSAGPLPDDPATIRYTIDPKAQWSDGVPVAAEDFEYLWRQMTTQSGVVDPVGYDRIVDVRAGAGGKIVDVVFESAPEHWRSLFSHLLPGHILKDAPDGFHGAMQRLPVMSAGPFMIRAADIGRGEIEFVPNDRYWAQAPGVGQIVTRRATGSGQFGAALRTGPGVLALVPDSPVATDVAASVPGVTTRTLASSAQLELGFNTVAPAVGDPRVRRAVAAAVLPSVVGRIVTGEASPAITTYPFPAQSGTTATGDPELTRSELTAAGYSREQGWWKRDGEPLTVTLGVEAADERARTAAYTVADQLHGAGIGAHVWELEPTALYADALPHGLVDAVVGWQTAQGQAEVSAISRFACVEGDRSSLPGSETPATPPARPRTTVSTLVPPTSGRTAEQPTGTSGTGATSGATTPTTSPTTPPRTLGASAPARASDIAGVCEPELEAALGRGEEPGPVDLAAAGALVAESALRVPLVRPTLLLADDGVDLSPGPSAGDTPGAASPRTVTDLFDTAPTWRSLG